MADTDELYRNEDADIRNEYDPTGDERDALELVYKRKHAMENSKQRKEAEENWDEWQRQWEAKRPEKERDDEWQSNHFVPMTTAIVETALAEMVDQTPRPLIMPRGTEDSAKAMVMRHIFDYTWEVANGDSQLYDVMKDALIFGTGIAQEYFLQDRRIVKQTTVDDDGEEEIEEKEVLDYDDVMMEPVKLQDFFVDEKARGFVGPYAARDAIRRYILHIDDFRRFFHGEVWNPLDNAKYVKPGGDTDYYEFYKPPEGINKDEEVEVLWYWAKSPEDWLIIVANDVVVKMGPNPYRHKQLPFARVVDIKRTHQFYGKGEAELLESIQDELNTMRRMIIDRNHLDIDKMFMVSDTLQLNDEDLIARPHGMIPVTGDLDSAKPVEYGDIPTSVQLTLEQLEDDAIKVTGIDPRAASTPQPRTATEAALLKEAALKKIRMKLRLLENEFLVRVGRLRVANIIQYYSQPKLEEIVGERGTEKFMRKAQELREQGVNIVTTDDGVFAERFRKIRTEGKRIDIDNEGNPVEIQEKGFHFFEARPEFFRPEQGGFDVKFAAGATLPLSKPLLQTKTTEMYDRLIQLALGNVGYDPVKLGDALLRVNDFDPEEFKQREQPQMGEGFSEERLAQSIEIANQENEMLMGGEKVPPTAYAPVAHTRVHVEFMNSPTFQDAQLDEDIIKNFIAHIYGELRAQIERVRAGEGRAGQAGQIPAGTGEQRPSFQGQGQQFNPPQEGGNVNNAMSQLMPGLMQGGADTPQVL